MRVLMNSQQEPFCGDEKKSTFCVGNSWGRPHASPHNIFLRGDAWGDVWGGYAWVSETGVSYIMCATLDVEQCDSGNTVLTIRYARYVDPITCRRCKCTSAVPSM